VTTLKCSQCPVIFRGEVTGSFEMAKDDPQLEEIFGRKLSEKEITEGTADCPDCGAPMYEVGEDPAA
jgi:hypothetical protein